MVTPRTGRPRGRPKKNFLDDPERYAVALSDALHSLGMTGKDAFTFVAAVLAAQETKISKLEDGSANIRYESALPGGPSVTIAGKADTLRGKSKLRPRKGSPQKAISEEEAHWRKMMALAFAIALKAKDEIRCSILIRQIVAEVGEVSFGETYLLPMLRAKFQPPDFSPPD